MKKIAIPVSGMHCVSCAQRIESSLKKLDGVADASVNFATEKATVEFDDTAVNENEIKNAIERLGYKAIFEDKKTNATKVEEEDVEKIVDKEKALREKEIKNLRALFLFL